MKSAAVILISVILFGSYIYPQDASSYFPANPGYTWTYKIVPLDSANNGIDTLSYYQTDSFEVAQNYKGKLADIIIAKLNLQAGLPSVPFDTTYISFEGSDAYTYFKLFNIDSLLSSLSSSKVLSKNSQINVLEGWLPYYRFASAENSAYQIFSIDTTVVFNNNSLAVRLEVKGTHTADQNIQTVNGELNCKKFVIDNIVSYLIAPTLPLKLFTISDTVWIASNQWIVQDFMPSTNVDLSFAGLGKFTIPGSRKTLAAQIPTEVNNSDAKVNDFKLYQNYPNPFNPSTIIKYSIPENSNVSLTIYDLLGNEVTTLINKEQNAGNYEVTFNPSLINDGISTGVYFYTLRTGTATITKKLIYLK